ncbi:ATP-dependent DNA helicase RecG [Paracandidimonas soli]|uniref:ATP-dependent DNA helicase RecG n=1 Tax=Paracandidimonas soli TaxID=1917182 RepID=A0A4R3VDF6_9BURK|nr:ATP-dependent DNA helicase RecG [Paracandidimonas soli]TCV01722.1 ATP-dependent DNA helicase RecG [Paracandidimonas soli]
MPTTSDRRASRSGAPARPDGLTPSERKLLQLGLRTPQDLIVHLPLRYEDETRIHAVGGLVPGQAAQVDVTVIRSEVQLRPRRQLHAVVEDGTGRIALRWLHFYPNQQKQLQAGAALRVRGEVRRGFDGLEMVHPHIGRQEEPLPSSLTPVYPSTAGLTQGYLRKAIARALDIADLSDTLPEALREQHGLMPFRDAIRLLHNPPPDVSEASLREKGHPAWKRIKFDELLAQQLSLAIAREERMRQHAHQLSVRNGALEQALRSSLPFQLTEAQERVIAEIGADLTRAHPMHRLLQGDVGSGKTIVAAFAATQAIDSGQQVAIMAPTELLATQHFDKLMGWLAPLGISVCWLTGSLTGKKRKEALQAIESGSAQLIVGTQALIQEGLSFARLGLIILDEQHRFGVGQRLQLSRKGEEVATTIIPHQLHMSATPIPRTLAMTFFADLDVSVIDTLPPGRTPVVTKLADNARRDEVIQRVVAEVRQGRQAYWVCPLVQESEALQLQTAEDTFQSLAGLLPDLRIGLIHGRLPTAEKSRVMDAFRSGEYDVLVATTVIEVGVDVPNASLMVVEHAERFGLAQLHQLRGRVGRGSAQSVCVLMYQSPLSLIARQRLRAMYETTDGFEIARRDLDLRGPGEFLGIRQSGTDILRFASLAEDTQLVEKAQEAVGLMRSRYPGHARRHMHRWMKGKQDFLRT